MAKQMGTCNARFWMPFLMLTLLVLGTLAFIVVKNMGTKEGFAGGADPTTAAAPASATSAPASSKPASSATPKPAVTTMHDLNAVTIQGHDLGKILSVTSSGSCKSACSTNAECKAAVFREVPEKDGKNCFLKRNMPMNSFSNRDGDNTYLKI